MTQRRKTLKEIAETGKIERFDCGCTWHFDEMEMDECEDCMKKRFEREEIDRKYGFDYVHR